MNHIIFLQEWNNSAVAILFALFLIPVLIAYLLVNMILKTIPSVQLYFQKIKATKRWQYWLIQVLIFLTLLALLFLTGYFWQ